MSGALLPIGTRVVGISGRLGVIVGVIESRRGIFKYEWIADGERDVKVATLGALSSTVKR